MRLVDMFYAFPSFLLALTLVAVLGPSLRNLILALTLTSWTGFTRLVRAEIMHLKEQDFVQAAVAAGAGPWRIVTVHLWPGLAGLWIIQASSVMASTVIAESGLSFLGLGVPADVPTWGAMLSSGRRVLTEAPHLSLAPGLALVLLVLAFNLLADGLRDSLDPRRTRHKN
jgi:peptide/nickel transport system permease protein